MIYYRKTEENIFARIEDFNGISKADFVKVEKGNYAINIGVILEPVNLIRLKENTPKSNEKDFYAAYLCAKEELEKRLEKLLTHDIQET